MSHPEKIEYVDYIMIEQRALFRRGRAFAKIKAVLMGFFWCFVPFGFLCSLYLAMMGKRLSFHYLMGILLFLTLVFIAMGLMFAD